MAGRCVFAKFAIYILQTGNSNVRGEKSYANSIFLLILFLSLTNLTDQPTTPSVDMASLSSYQSPSVKGGSHEECAWFLVEEAVKLSPVFARIYENQRFIDLLESLKQNNSDLEVKSHT